MSTVLANVHVNYLFQSTAHDKWLIIQFDFGQQLLLFYLFPSSFNFPLLNFSTWNCAPDPMLALSGRLKTLFQIVSYRAKR